MLDVLRCFGRPRYSKRGVYLPLLACLASVLLFLGEAVSAPGDLDTTFNSTGKLLAVYDSTAAVIPINTAWSPPVLRGTSAVIVAGAQTLQAACIDPVKDAQGRTIACNGWLDGVNYSRSQVYVLVMRNKQGVMQPISPLLATDISNKPADATAIALQSTFLVGSVPKANYIVAQVIAEDPLNVVQSAPVYRLARYTMDESAWTWTLDTTFGTSGYVKTSLSGAENIALTVQPDGKIIAAVSGKMARYNANGSTDTSLGPDAAFNTPGVVSIITAVQIGTAVQPDGKILLYGSRYNPLALEYQGQLTRHNADGSVDVGFGSSGTVDVGLQQSTGGTPFVVQPDGKIVVGGTVAVTNYNATKLTAPSGYSFYTNAVADYEYGYTTAIKRFNMDGTLDTSFGTGGSANLGTSLAGSGFTNYSGGINESPTTYDYTKPFTRGFVASAPSSIVIQNNGKIVVAAHVTEPGLMQSGVVVPATRYEGWGVMRLTSSGSFDSSTTANTPFSVNGKLVLNFAVDSIVDEPALSLDANGKVVASGTGFGAAGATDSSFIEARWLGDTLAANDLRVKLFASPNPAYVGGNLTYTAVVSNIGSASQSGVSFTNILPGGVSLNSAVYYTATGTQQSCTGSATVTCTIGAMNAGQDITVKIVVTPTVATSSLSNTVSVAGATDNNTADNSATVAVAVTAPAPNLVLTQVSSPYTSVSAGDDFPATLVVKNVGGAAVTTPFDVGIRFADNVYLPSSILARTTIPSLAAGASVTIDWPLPEDVFGVLVPGYQPPATYDLLGVADIDNAIAEGNEADNTLAGVTPMEVLPYADLRISMTDAPDPANIGDQIAYTVSVLNQGPSIAEASTVLDTLPSGVTYLSATPTQGVCAAPAGGVLSCNFGPIPMAGTASVVLLVKSPSSNALLLNSASIGSATGDPDLSNNSASQTTIIGQGGPDLAATALTVSPGTTPAGGAITLNDTVQNQGGSAAPGFVVSYDLMTTPPLTLAVREVAGLAVGASNVASTSATVPLDLLSGTYTVQMTADVADQVLENREDNNSRSILLNVGAAVQAADLSLTMVDSPDPVTVGNNLAYTLTVNNAGPVMASATVLTNSLPAGVTLVSASASQGTCSGTTTVTCSLGSLNSGAVATVAIVVTPTTVGALSNTASVSSSVTDPSMSNNSATATTTVSAVTSADLAIANLDSPDPVLVNGKLTYTITVNNAGPSVASNVKVTDSLPSTAAVVSSLSASQGSCTISGITVNCVLGDMAVGASATTTIVIDVTPTVTGTITNTATVSSDTADVNAANNSVTASTLVNPSADLSVTSTDSPDPVTAGDNVAYTLVVSNAGPSTASAVVLSDVLPAGTTFVSATSPCTQSAGSVTCNLGSLTSGATASVLVTVTSPSVTSVTTLSNTATVTSATADINSANNSVTESTTVNPSTVADLSVSGSVSPSVASAGTNLTYAITVNNVGPSTAQGVTLSDTLPAGLTFVSATPSVGTCSGSTTVTCSLGTLNVAASATVTLVAKTTALAVPSIINAFSVSGTTVDTNAANNSVSLTATVGPAADLAITNVDSPDPVLAGAALTYTLTASNVGPSVASAVVVSDVLPSGFVLVSAIPSVGTCSGLTCALGDLASGANATVIVTATAPTVTAATVFNSTASVSSTTTDTVSTNNSATASTTVNPAADLALAISASPEPVAVNSNITYTITLNNLGPNAATAVNVKDNLPSSLTLVSFSSTQGTCSGSNAVTCSLGTVNSGATVTMTIVAKTDSTGGTVSNTVSITSSGVADPNATNNTATANSTVVETQNADLSVTMTDSPDPVAVGSNISYTIVVRNGGPAAAPVTLRQTLPSSATAISASGAGASCSIPNSATQVDCTINSLASGATVTITAVATANTENTAISSTVTVDIPNGASVVDPNSANNSATTSTAARRSANLELSLTDNPDPVLFGSDLVYTMSVTNLDAVNAAANVIATNTLPSAVTLVSMVASQGSCSGTTTISCMLGTLAAATAATVTITVKPTTVMLLSDSATVTADVIDPVLTNNSATTTTTVLASANMAVTQTDSPDPLTLGGNLTYTMAVSNAGPSTASNARLTDILPTGATLVSASASVGTCTGTTLLTCSLGNLSSGATATVTIVVKPSVAGSLSNTASVQSDVADPDNSNNEASVVTTVVSNQTVDVMVQAVTTTTTSAPPFGRFDIQTTIKNQGTANITNPFSVVLKIGPNPSLLEPVMATFSIPSLAAGAFDVRTTTVEMPFYLPPDAYQIEAVADSGNVLTESDKNNNSLVGSSVIMPDYVDLVILQPNTLDPGVLDSPDPVNAGSNLSYTFDVHNHGPSAGQNVVVQDVLPAGVTAVSATVTGVLATCTVGSTITCNLGTLVEEDTAKVTIVVKPTIGGTLNNTITVTSTTADQYPEDNAVVVTTTVNGASSADLAVTMTDSPDPVLAGSDLTYTATVNNTGPSAAASVTVNDTLPSGTTLVSVTSSMGSCSGTSAISCTLGTLNSGQSATVTLVVRTSTAGSLSNTVSVSSTVTDPSTANNSATALTTVSAQADLAIAKTGPSSVNSGSNISYTLVVSNAGPSAASTVTVTDTLPSGVTLLSASATQGSCSGSTTIACSLGTLNSGASATVTIVVTAPVVSVVSSVSNVASVSSTTADANSSNNGSSAITTVNPVVTSANLSITKTATASVASGGSISYTLSVNNAGPDAASSVSISDVLPSNVTYVSVNSATAACSYNTTSRTVTCAQASLANAGTISVSISVTAPTVTVATTVSNTASVSSATADPVTANNSSSASTTVSPLSANLSISKTATASVASGGSISYTLSVSNAGPDAASSVSVSDVLPSNVTYVSVNSATAACSYNTTSRTVTCAQASLANAGTISATIVVTAPSVITATTVSNTATVSSATSDPVSTNNSSSASTTVNPLSANLSISKTAPASVASGASISYTLSVSNAGPDTASSVSISDVLPSNVSYVSVNSATATCSYNTTSRTVTCTQASLANAGTISVSISVTAPTVTVATTVSNTASVSSATADPVTTNNSSTASTSVSAMSTNLSISKTAPASVSSGASISYTLSINNAGPDAASSVTVTDSIPAGTVYVSAIPSVGTCSGTTTVTCNLGTLANGASASVTIVVTAPTVTTATTVSNTATVSSATSDPVSTNNSSSASTTVNPLSANLSISKTATASVTSGGDISYTLSINNAGPDAASSVSISDVLPSNVSYVSAAPSAGATCSYNTTTRTVTCTQASLANGGTISATIVVTAPTVTVATTVSNTASVSSATADPVTTNNSSTASTSVSAMSANLSISKTAPASVASGASISYTLSINNAGPDAASSVTVTDSIPAGTAYVSAIPSVGTCSGTTTVTCNLGTLANGASASVTIVVTAPSVSVATTVSNTASVSSATSDPVSTNNSSSASTTVNPPSANLSITKTAPASVASGASISYTLSANNTGPDAASSVSISDVLPSNVSYVSAAPSAGATCSYNTTIRTVTCTQASLANGGTISATIVVTAPTVTTATTVSNTATVSSATSDPVSTNNSSSASTSVIPLIAGTDLSISEASIPTSTIATGGFVTLRNCVLNGGGSDVAGFNIGYTLMSGASVIQDMGSRSVLSLAAGSQDCADTRINLPSTLTLGSYTLRVSADSLGVIAEDDEANNTKTTVNSLTISNVVDLRMTTLTADKTSLGVGEKITLSNSVINEGTIATSKSFSVSFYLSLGNSTYETTDKLLGSRSVPMGLAAGATNSANTLLTVAATTVPQDYIIIARVDPTSTTLPNGAIIESDETDNLRAGPGLTVKRDQDLTFNSALSPSASSVGLGKILPVSNSVQNQGTTGMSATTTVRFYLSSDSTLVMSGTGADYQIGSRSVAILAAGGISSALTNLTIPTTVPALPAPGKAYYLFAYIDATKTLPETPTPAAEDNNSIMALGQINITVDQDLQVNALTSSATLGTPINVSLALATSRNIVLSNQIKNFGASSTSGSIIVRFYLSTDAIIDPATDIQIGTRTVTALASGALSTLANTTAVVPTTTAQGPYYLGAYVDPLKTMAETNLDGTAEQNNGRTANVAATTIMTAVNVGP